MSEPGHVLGFAGMLASGADPQEAYEEIKKVCRTPEVREILRQLHSGLDGAEVMEFSRRRWAEYGFPPPWETEVEET